MAFAASQVRFSPARRDRFVASPISAAARIGFAGRLALAVVTAWVSAATACVPELGERDSLIKETTILAVQGEPPDVVPGSRVRFSVLVGSPDGAIAAPLARWDYCISAKRLGENGAATAACLRDDGVEPAAAGLASAIETAIPANACNVFGPRTLTPDERPRDPDITGGFYQPLRVTVGGKVAFGFERISCGAPLSPALVVDEFTRSYVPNRNPILVPMALPRARRSARVVLRAAWPADAPEVFPVYDIAAKVLVDHRESMRVSWFATAGTFDTDRTGRDESEPELFTDNVWTAPPTPQPVHFFVVLRDPRGGTAFQTFTTQVE